MAESHRHPMNLGVIKKLDNLSDQLDTAEKTSEATTKEVQRARRTAEHVERDVRAQRSSSSTKRKPKRSKERYSVDGKSNAAVELGRKGGAATAKALTRQQRSALATKAATTRWHRR